MMSVPTIDLNCDLGEDPAMLERDRELLTLVTSANIACGGHAGDEGTMDAVVAAAVARGCAIGAHTSYADRANFGRVEIEQPANQLESDIADQIAALTRIAARHGVRPGHVKPHGALYHAAMRRPGVAESIARAILRVDRSLAVVTQALPPASVDLAAPAYAALGLGIIREAFADRRYEPDGTLRGRSLPGALIESPHEAASQAFAIAHLRCIPTEGGGVVPIEAETICIHSDTPGAIATARAVREVLRKAGFTLAPAARNNGP